jgi:hypothetical protein
MIVSFNFSQTGFANGNKKLYDGPWVITSVGDGDCFNSANSVFPHVRRALRRSDARAAYCINCIPHNVYSMLSQIDTTSKRDSGRPVGKVGNALDSLVDFVNNRDSASLLRSCITLMSSVLLGSSRNGRQG